LFISQAMITLKKKHYNAYSKAKGFVIKCYAQQSYSYYMKWKV